MGLTAAAIARNERRTTRRYFEARVAAVAEVGSIMRRITLTAPELGDLEPLGPDEFFALVVPPRGGTLPGLGALSGDLVDALNALPDGERPDVRWYTVRAHRPAAAEIDVDVVVHGDDGPGSAWARRAAVGDAVGVRETNAAYPDLPAGTTQLLVADETSHPALCAILESQVLGPESVVLLEVPSHDAVPRLAPPRDGDVRIRVVERGDAVPGRRLLDALRELRPPYRLGHAWVCGEAGLVRDVRRHLVGPWRVDPGLITFSGYWRLGQQRR